MFSLVGTAETTSANQAKEAKPDQVDVLIDLKRWLQGTFHLNLYIHQRSNFYLFYLL